MSTHNEKTGAELQPFTNITTNPSNREEPIDIATLCLMPIVQLGILLSVGQPCLTLGAISLAVGAIGGFLKNQADSGSLQIAIQKVWNHRHPPDATPGSISAVVVEPVVVLVPEDELVRIDASLQDKDISAGRRRWIMIAIDEKLARERNPEFPVAA